MILARKIFIELIATEADQFVEPVVAQPDGRGWRRRLLNWLEQG